MINLKKGPSSLHVGLNGSSDALLNQCHCQSKGNEPAPCVCTLDISLQPLPYGVSVWGGWRCKQQHIPFPIMHTTHRDKSAPAMEREKTRSRAESSADGMPLAKESSSKTCKYSTMSLPTWFLGF